MSTSLPLWLTAFLAIWAAVGPLLGILLGHRLLRSSQRRQWLAENRLKEWQELLTTVTDTCTELVRCDRSDEHRISELRFNAQRVIANRVFINQDVRQADLFKKVMKANNYLIESNDAKGFAEKLTVIGFEINELAAKDIKNM